MSIFFDTLIYEEGTLEKEKNLVGAIKKVLSFMKKSMIRKQKDEEVFYLFVEGERIKIISEDGKSEAYFNKSIKLSDFCLKCEEIYFKYLMQGKEFNYFNMHYIVQIEDQDEGKKNLLVSPEAMILQGIDGYHGIKLEVKK